MYCVYRKNIVTSHYTIWQTSCRHTVRCDSPEEIGFSFAPLPTDDDKIYCTYCGKPIKLDK